MLTISKVIVVVWSWLQISTRCYEAHLQLHQVVARLSDGNTMASNLQWLDSADRTSVTIVQCFLNESEETVGKSESSNLKRPRIVIALEEWVMWVSNEK